MKCRICGGSLMDVCAFNNIPSAAQHLPMNKDDALSRACDLMLDFCTACGLVQHTGEPVAYYKDVIRATAYSSDMREFRVQQFGEIVRKYDLSGKAALEIGCGKGEYLQLLRETGVAAAGIENSAENIVCCQKSGLEVYKGYCGDVPYMETIDEKFEAFFSFNYFEHLPDLPRVLVNIRRCLRDDGVGIVEVPNFDMILKENMISEIIPDHIYYFTAETLKNTLSLYGFRILECDSIWHDYILHAVCAARTPPSFVSVREYATNLRNAIRQFVSENDGKRMAIWGAGHQAMTVLSLCDENALKSFDFVVDSAPFKQDRFMPVSGLPIVSPERLTESNIGAILVIAAGYGIEIADRIKAEDEVTAVAILENTSVRYI